MEIQTNKQKTFKEIFGPDFKGIQVTKTHNKMEVTLITEQNQIEIARTVKYEFDYPLKDICDDLNLDYLGE